MAANQGLAEILPAKLYRGLLILTCAWPGQRVAPNSLLIKVHEANSPIKLPLIWCGGPNELDSIIATFGNDRTIYGLRGTYDFVEPTDEVICKLSEYYANQIELAAIPAPYIIAGNCAAAYLAAEISNLLILRGHKIGFLGLIERDVTVYSIPLQIARKLFRGIDRIGTIFCDISHTWENRSIIDGVKHAFSIILIGLKLRKQKRDPRLLIRYKHGQIEDKSYELKPCPNNASLLFIRWGVFGFYQFKFFQKYWKNIIKGRITIDFIAGYSHQHPKWSLIIEKLSYRINEAGH